MRFLNPLLSSLGSAVNAPGGRERNIGGTHDESEASSSAPQPEAQVFTLTSASFENGGAIPDRLARQSGVSPQLSWTEPPKGTARFVIVMDDPDAEAVVGHTFVHWVACVPERMRSLPEGASAGGWTRKTKTLAGDATSTAYRGPLPPSGTHRYHIGIYAMNRSFRDTNFQDLAHSRKANDTRTYTREHFESLFRADILASAQISGTYSARH